MPPVSRCCCRSLASPLSCCRLPRANPVLRLSLQLFDTLARCSISTAGDISSGKVASIAADALPSGVPAAGATARLSRRAVGSRGGVVAAARRGRTGDTNRSRLLPRRRAADVAASRRAVATTSSCFAARRRGGAPSRGGVLARGGVAPTASREPRRHDRAAAAMPPPLPHSTLRSSPTLQLVTLCLARHFDDRLGRCQELEGRVRRALAPHQPQVVLGLLGALQTKRFHRLTVRQHGHRKPRNRFGRLGLDLGRRHPVRLRPPFSSATRGPGPGSAYSHRVARPTVVPTASTAATGGSRTLPAATATVGRGGVYERSAGMLRGDGAVPSPHRAPIAKSNSSSTCRVRVRHWKSETLEKWLPSKSSKGEKSLPDRDRRLGHARTF